MYSKYNFVIRFVMKRIAKKAEAPVDTTRDYEFTDWTKLDLLVDEFVASTSTDINVGKAEGISIRIF